MERAKHECTANKNKLNIYYTGDNWAMQKDSFAWWANFCPYCGERLEPPDVKIEVSEQALWDINKKLKSAQQLLWGHPRESSDLIYSVIEEITGAIHDTQPDH